MLVVQLLVSRNLHDQTWLSTFAYQSVVNSRDRGVFSDFFQASTLVESVDALLLDVSSLGFKVNNNLKINYVDSATNEVYSTVASLLPSTREEVIRLHNHLIKKGYTIY